VLYSAEELSRRRLHTSNLTTRQVLQGDTSADRARLFDDFISDVPSKFERRRAASRLLTHELFDFVRTRGYKTASFDHARDTSVSAVLLDLAENLGRPPRAREWVREWEIQ
jgi:hypothetical protein